MDEVYEAAESLTEEGEGLMHGQMNLGWMDKGSKKYESNCAMYAKNDIQRGEFCSFAAYVLHKDRDVHCEAEREERGE